MTSRREWNLSVLPRRLFYKFDSINQSLACNEPPRSTDIDRSFIKGKRIFDFPTGDTYLQWCSNDIKLGNETSFCFSWLFIFFSPFSIRSEVSTSSLFKNDVIFCCFFFPFGFLSPVVVSDFHQPCRRILIVHGVYLLFFFFFLCFVSFVCFVFFLVCHSISTGALSVWE